MRMLVLYFSQSGETRRAAEAFSSNWSGWEIVYQPIKPQIPYPHPWRSIWKFFGVLPDCLLGNGPPIEPLADEIDDVDLVTLAYPVWFLSPALPVQSVFSDAGYRRVLGGTRVITICVCRSMWNCASEKIKSLLKSITAHHLDNIVVTHHGSFWLTLVSTPRALLFGRKNAMLGMFPKAGISDEELGRLEQLGQVAARRFDPADDSPLLRGEPAVEVKRWLVVPELLGWYFFSGWARIIDVLGRIHSVLKLVGIAGFIVFLLSLILIGLPIAQIVTWCLSPIVGGRLNRYVTRLAEPTGAQQPN